MIKYFCNKCGVELSKKEEKSITVVSSRRVMPLRTVIEIHFCDNCLFEFLGKEEVEKQKQAYKEYLRVKEERRKAKEEFYKELKNGRSD